MNLNELSHLQARADGYAFLVMRWNETAFRTRVEARCKELGYPSLAAMLDKAGLGEDYLRRHPGRQGRGILNIEAIARACEWTLAEALGIDASTPSQLDARRMRLAIEAADRTIGSNLKGPERLNALAELSRAAYELLFVGETSGPLPDDALLAIVSAALSREFSSKK